MSTSVWARRRSCLPTATTVPYRIFRAPIKGGAAPLQLPATTVVDLEYSGCVSLPPPGQKDFTIVFSPTGAVDSIYYANSRSQITDSIYLLIGKRERTINTFPKPRPATRLETDFTNVEDLNNLWVTVNAQSGVVNSEPLATGAADAYYVAYQLAYDTAKAAGKSDEEADAIGIAAGKAAARNAAASLATQGQGMGGK